MTIAVKCGSVAHRLPPWRWPWRSLRPGRPRQSPVASRKVVPTLALLGIAAGFGFFLVAPQLFNIGQPADHQVEPHRVGDIASKPIWRRPPVSPSSGPRPWLTRLARSILVHLVGSVVLRFPLGPSTCLASPPYAAHRQLQSTGRRAAALRPTGGDLLMIRGSLSSTRSGGPRVHACRERPGGVCARCGTSACSSMSAFPMPACRSWSCCSPPKIFLAVAVEGGTGRSTCGSSVFPLQVFLVLVLVAVAIWATRNFGTCILYSWFCATVSSCSGCFEMAGGGAAGKVDDRPGPAGWPGPIGPGKRVARRTVKSRRLEALAEPKCKMLARLDVGGWAAQPGRSSCPGCSIWL